MIEVKAFDYLFHRDNVQMVANKTQMLKPSLDEPIMKVFLDLYHSETCLLWNMSKMIQKALYAMMLHILDFHPAWY